MVIDSDKILTPETDETVYVRQLKLEKIDEYIFNQLNKYIKNKKCAVWAYLCKIETLNKDLKVFETEHFCLVIKPDKKFKYPRDPQALFDILAPLLKSKNDFVDVSVLGWSSTMQFDFKKEDAICLYCQY